jgi:hypothetical protein
VREPEFLPRWYPLLLRRRRIVAVQAWVTALAAIGLTLWALSEQKQAKAAAATLADLNRQVVQTSGDLNHLKEIEEKTKELDGQNQIMNRLGINVPVTRMLSVLGHDLMPRRMALREFHFQTEVRATPPTTPTGPAQINRKLRVDLVGVAPTGDELATFLSNLVSISYFDEVKLVKEEETSGEGYLMRQFEVQFALNLNEPDSNPVVSDAR